MPSIELPVLDVAEPPRPPYPVLVRYGYLGMIGHFLFDGEGFPRWGSTVVVRTDRGTELAKVLAEPCSPAGRCRMISQEQRQQYIRNSGGRDYPFSNAGRILRVATPDDLARQQRLEASKGQYMAECRRLIEQLQLPMRLIEVEPLLGMEMYTFYFAAEHRVDFRALVRQLAARLRSRVQMHQVGSRDEARLVADFETCGQECCCRQFLKVLRPVNMGTAKLQKATLDPSKISGRCGRLKCCLRYEEATYEELRRRLPKVGASVQTAEGVGIVEETAILAQLVKVRLEDGRVIAVPNEELLARDLPAGATPAAGRRSEQATAAPPRQRDPADEETSADDGECGEDTRAARPAQSETRTNAGQAAPDSAADGARNSHHASGGQENRRRRDRSRGR